MHSFAAIPLFFIEFVILLIALTCNADERICVCV